MIPFGQAEGISNVGDIWSMRERDAMRGMRARGAQLAGAAMLALTASLLSGCGGASLTGASPATGSPSLGDRFSQLFGSKSQAAEAPSAPQQVQNSGLTCPRVSIRSGAATYAVGLPGKDASGMDLRYQATIIRTARDCNLNNGTISARIGIMGRIIVGPAGAPPSVEVPLRVAVVDGCELASARAQEHDIDYDRGPREQIRGQAKRGEQVVTQEDPLSQRPLPRPAQEPVRDHVDADPTGRREILGPQHEVGVGGLELPVLGRAIHSTLGAALPVRRVGDDEVHAPLEVIGVLRRPRLKRHLEELYVWVQVAGDGG